MSAAFSFARYILCSSPLRSVFCTVTIGAAGSGDHQCAILYGIGDWGFPGSGPWRGIRDQSQRVKRLRRQIAATFRRCCNYTVARFGFFVFRAFGPYSIQYSDLGKILENECSIHTSHTKYNTQHKHISSHSHTPFSSKKGSGSKANAKELISNKFDDRIILSQTLLLHKK